ncbi:hypothetical protein PSACC_00176 [Paramicrosporidium saccamoebae]|uniref:Uncharacterized protein n=1 Tax=Paramicrosporidium saccamoebae TaxID=1246581 RepID=A0A2H9TQJ6_9FUNG|nr:hypothetical protein PSACC_00176 [Paramicrosporidium saccamoebae]
MKTILLVLICALLKFVSASRFGRYGLRLGRPIVRDGSAVKVHKTSDHIELQVHDNFALIKLVPKGLQISYEGAILWRTYRRELEGLIRLPEQSTIQADDLLVVVLGGFPGMSQSCLEEILRNFSKKSLGGAATEVVIIPLIGE